MTALKTNDAYDHLFEQYGQIYNVDPLLGKTAFHLESSGNPGTKDSPAGAHGGMQIMSGLADHYGIDPRDMKQAIPAAMAYLAEGLQATGGDPAGALAYYNGGPATLQRWKPETQGYVTRALSYYPQMRMAANAPPAGTVTDTPVQYADAGTPNEAAIRSRWGLAPSNVTPANGPTAAPVLAPDEAAIRARWGLSPATTAQPRPIVASDSAASAPVPPPAPAMGNPSTALNALGGDQFIPNPLASNPSQDAYAALRSAVARDPSLTYSQNAPIAMDASGKPHLALPGVVHDLLGGAVDLAYGPRMGTVTPEATNALAAGVLARPGLMRSPANVPGRLSLFPRGAPTPEGPTPPPNPLASPGAEIPTPSFGAGAGRMFDVDAQGNVTSAQTPAVMGKNPLAAEIMEPPGSMPARPLSAEAQAASANPLTSPVPTSSAAAPGQSAGALTPIEQRLVAAIEGPKAAPPSSGPFNVMGGVKAPPAGNAGPPPGTPPPGTPGYTPTTPGVSPAEAAAMSPAEAAIHAAIRDTPPPAPMIPPQTQRGANELADQVIRYFYAGKPALAAENAVVPPGYHPSLTGMFNDPGVATLHRGMESVSSAPAMLADSNAQAINAAAQRLTGHPGDADLMKADVNRITTPMREAALANKADMDPTKVQAAIDAADKLIAGPYANRPGALKYIHQVRDTLGKPSNRALPETDPEMMLGAHQGINDILAPLAQSTDADKAAASAGLMKLKPLLKEAIESGAPGMKDYFATHAELMKPADAQRYFEGLNLSNSTGDTRLAAVDSAIKSITKQQNAPGISKAEWVSPDQFNQLVALRNALRMEAARGAGKPINSTTFQNMATNSRVAQLAANPLINLAAGSMGTGNVLAGLVTKQGVDMLHARSRDMFSNALLRRLLNVNGEGEAALAGGGGTSGSRRSQPGPGAPWNPLASGPAGSP